MRTVVDLAPGDDLLVSIEQHEFRTSVVDAAALVAKLSAGIAQKVATKTTDVVEQPRPLVKWQRIHRSDYRAFDNTGRTFHVYKNGRGWLAEVDGKMVTDQPVSTKKAAQTAALG